MSQHLVLAMCTDAKFSKVSQVTNSACLLMVGAVLPGAEGGMLQLAPGVSLPVRQSQGWQLAGPEVVRCTRCL